MTRRYAGFIRALSQGRSHSSLDLRAGLGLRESGPLSALRVCLFLVVIGAAVSPPLANLAAALCMLFFLALPDLKARAEAVRAQPMVRALGVFALVLLGAAVLAAPDAGWRAAASALFEWRHLLLVPIAAGAFAEVAARRLFVQAFVAFCVAAAVLVLIALFANWSRVNHPVGVLFRNSVTQALLLNLGGFLALLAALSSLTRTGRQKAILAAAAVLILGVLVGSQTGRSGIVALTVMLLTGVVLHFRGYAALVCASAALAFAVAVVLCSPVQKSRFQQAVSELVQRDRAAAESTSMGVRVLMWRDTARMIQERPLLGWGLGRYRDAHAAIIARTPSEGAMSVPSTDPHNQFLRLWAEAGLPGLAAFLAVLWCAWRQRGPRIYAVAGLAILAAWCVNSLFSSHFWVFNEGHLIAVFMGVLLARAPGAGASPAAQPSAASAAASTSS